MHGTQYEVGFCPVPAVAEATITTQPLVDRTAPARVLRSAARYLDRHGWIQGAYYDAGSGGFAPAACVVGAIGMVCYGGRVDAPAQNLDDPGFAAFEQTLAYLDMFLIDRDNVVAYEFNDTRGRTCEQVIDALYLAACAWDTAHSVMTLGGSA